MAKGGGGGGGGGGKGGSGVVRGGTGGSSAAHFHGRFDNRFFRNHFPRNQAVLGGWGWGWPYDGNGYSNTNVVVYPQVTPQFATGSVAATPCHWNAETFTVPASRGGTRPIQIVSCQ